MNRFDELIETWERLSNYEVLAGGKWRNMSKAAIFDYCIEDLKRTLRLVEADEVCKKVGVENR